MQMIKKYWIYILFVLSITAFAVTQYYKQRINNIALKTKLTNSGWGYDIYVKGKLFITQDNIPTIKGFKAFKTEDDAKKIGNLMVLKMKQNQTPNVTEQELDSCNINR